MVFWPGDDTNLTYVLMNERSKMGHGTKKVARTDRMGHLRWQNAPPEPADNIRTDKLPKGFMFAEQTEEFTIEDTKGWLHRALVDDGYSNKQDFKYEADTTS